ncbi:MAG: FAD-binding protein, partial [Gemmatimonadetes bacterium]|nr:FAD-binding protein [Gemmatimonadota bacterium]
MRFDSHARALYATDASIYEVEPIGVVLPRTSDDVSATLELARSEGIPVLPRGGGTSQCGQAIGHAIVIDTSRYLNRVLAVDPAARTATAEPGVVLDHLNDLLSPAGLMFPVDVATANRATIGGMAGNNSGGARSIRYGIMADNVAEIEAELADGSAVRFGADRALSGSRRTLARSILDLVTGYRSDLEARVPKVLRHVAGYNLHRLLDPSASMAELLVGSEGTLAYFRSITLELAETPRFRVLGVCRFTGLVPAMAAVQHIVTLDPHAVELVDEHVLRLARSNEAFRPTVEQFMSGAPGAVLLVEFAGDDPVALSRRLERLEELVRDLDPRASTSGAPDPGDQARIWALRKASLSIAMSMKGDRKPVSFIEDCAVPLSRLAEYATALEEIFERHDTSSIWYAHASVGCLHVRPALSMKDPADVRRMRSIAEEVHEVVRRLGGSHSGEHGDGILRSEFIRTNLGPDLAEAFRRLKAVFDPAGLMNPGRIVDPPDMDDRNLFRFKPDYRPKALPTVLDWGAWGGFSGAVEMCNNNGACRKDRSGVMCPSFRATRDEADTTRGRANVLRRALDGGFGPHGELAPEVQAALDLCIGCKACKTECPTGVDMARMKAEVAHRRVEAQGATPRQVILGHLPSAARLASRFPGLANLPARVPAARRWGESLLGIGSGRPLPTWHRAPFRDRELPRWNGPSHATG